MTCVMCQGPLTGKQKRYCSDLCSMRGYTAQRPGGRHQYPRTCGWCGTGFIGWDKSSTYCSRQCGVDAVNEPSRRRRSLLRRQRATHRLQQSAAGTRGVQIHVAGTCPRCSQSFVRTVGRRISMAHLPRHCSARCQERDKSDRRRARQAGVNITVTHRRAIHERDAWVCHICGDEVDRTATVPDLAAPVLDHVLPLARGGEHTDTNLRTAHFWCNSVKRDLLVAV